MSVLSSAADIRDEFDFLDDWEARYAHIIDLGKSAPPLAEDEKIEANRVRGCASQVWMVTNIDESGVMTIRADSDAMIVSGLIALLVRLFSETKAEEIDGFDAAGFLEEIGVANALSAQRSNGLASMLDRIKREARAHLTASAR